MTSYHNPDDGAGRRRAAEGRLSFSGLFGYQCRPGFPSIDKEETGIRATVEVDQIVDDHIHLKLLVTHRFKVEFSDCFNSINQAILVLIERPNTGQKWQVSLSDPNVTWLEYTGPNFDSEKAKESGYLAEQYCEIPAVLPLFAGLDTDTLYIRAVLQEVTSNVLALHCHDEEGTDDSCDLNSYLYGEPHDIQQIGTGSEAVSQELTSVGATLGVERLKIESIKPHGGGDVREYRMSYTATLESGESWQELYDWLKKLYVTAVTEEFQYSAAELLLDQTAVFTEDIKESGSDSGSYIYKGYVNLSNHLGRNFTPGTYYFQISGTQFHSETAILRVEN